MTIIATDDFSSGSLASYTQVHTTSCVTVSGQLRGAGEGVSSGVIRSAETYAPNQYFQFVAKGSTSAAAYYSCVLRGTGTVSAGTLDGYRCTTGVGGDIYISRIDNGVGTDIASGSSSYAPDNVYRAEIVGSTITFYKNGISILSATDATYSTGKPGIEFYQGAPGLCVIDDAEFGDDSVAGGPSITSTSSANPEHGSSLTITGTAFGATQGAGGAVIGGTTQTETSWADTSIPVTVDRGANQYGVPVNVVVTDNALVSSSPYALTSLQPQAGWSFVNLTSIASVGVLDALPSLSIGNQIAYFNNGGGTVVYPNGTFSTTLPFDCEAWDSAGGWGAIATQSFDVRLMRTPYEFLPRGGADVWDQPQAGVILVNDFFDAADASGVISATITEANDTLAATSTSALVASAAATEANDAATATATAALVASATITEANDTLAASVTSAAAGLTVDAAITEANDTTTATAAAALVASATVTEANDTGASTATAALVASATITEANDTLAATTTAALVASATVTEANDTASSTATAALVASAAVTEANDTATATTTAALVASATVTEADDTGASTVTAALVASATIAEANDALAATIGSLVGISATIIEADDAGASTVTAALVAAGAVTEADDIATSTATAALVVSAAATEANDTGAASALLEPFPQIDATITEADDTATSTAAAGLTASAALTEADDNLAASALLALVLNANATDAGDVLVSRVDTGAGGGGATPEEVWNYVLSNGLTAGETLAQALAHATNCCG